MTSVVSFGIKVPIIQTMVKAKTPKRGQQDFEESVGIVALEAIKSKNARSSGRKFWLKNQTELNMLPI